MMQTLDQLRAGELAGASALKLCEELRDFPREIFTLADSLERLDLSDNDLSSLPDDLPRLHRLRILFCYDNQFTELPDVLGQCPSLRMIGFKSNRIATVPPTALPAGLRWLILTDNVITALPETIGECTDLQKLMLAGNHLTALPVGLGKCRRLELLRVAANRLTEFPEWLTSLPRLAWLAFAGNPFTAEAEARVSDRTADDAAGWDGLELTEVLGQGASGIIHAAQRDGMSLAVKLFKGAVTSDGSPHCEMNACLHAGAHPHLIPALNRLPDRDGQPALLMARIPEAFTPLAGPPSVETCTRDVYAPDTVFAPAEALRIATAIARAAAHLHDRGILHGDLYAHNILHDGQGHALIGDFGAASIIPCNAIALERIEARAFGCLLEELAARCTAVAAPAATLGALASACLDDAPEKRPLFADIVNALVAPNDDIT